jgi:hypothetical protein
MDLAWLRPVESGTILVTARIVVTAYVKLQKTVAIARMIVHSMEKLRF